MIYHVRHVTRYDYQAPVDLGAHLAHLRPRPLPYQKVLRAGVHAAPAVSWRRDGRDHFGNEVTWLFLDVAHAAFQVTADAIVDVEFPAPADAAATPPWEVVARQAREPGTGAWQAAEFAFDSPRAPADGGARDYAAHCFAPGRAVLEALLDLNARIRRDFTFRAGVTTTTTRIAEVLRRREGVCQDFTHLMISALRAYGLPARYVSGYIRTVRSKDEIALRGADASHAWVAVWCGDKAGWIHLDPTNDLVAHEDHVAVAWGRDFSDVSPLRGVILGGDSHSYGVDVTLVPTG